MATQFEEISKKHPQFIEEQHVFFVGSAAAEGRVNVSPKGMDCLVVLGPNRVVWLNYTGSGNETAGHLLLENRITLMWCSFTKRPMIMRAYGTVKTVHANDPSWDELASHFDVRIGARQIFDVTVDMLQTSCGYAVPYMDFTGDRDVLNTWTQDRGEDGVREFWRERNAKTIDGAPTGIPTDTSTGIRAA